MLNETVAILVCGLLLALMGTGPALWLLANEQRFSHRLAVAPALGYALLVIAGFPLSRYVGPVNVWAWPATLAVIAASLLLAGVVWRRQPGARRKIAHPALAIAVVSFFLMCGLVLVSPLLLRGIQYAVFRSNASDAFLYMSLAESLRTATWNTLLQGTAFTRANLDGITRLAQVTPTALFTARFIGVPFLLNKMVILAWAAEIAGTTIPNIYLAHHLLALGVMLPLCFLLGEWLHFPRWLVFAGSGAIVLGFWARFVIETDAGYEISVLPMTLLFVVGWVQLEQSRAAAFSRERLLMAVAAAAIAALYIPIALVAVLAVLLYYGLGLFQRTLPVAAVGRHLVTAGLVLVILGLSGQLDFLVRGWLDLASRAQAERVFPPLVLNLIRAEGPAALWGLPPSLLWGNRSLWIRAPLNLLASGLGLLFTLALAAGAVMVGRKSVAPAERITFAVLAAGLLVALGELALDNSRSAGKALTYVYPFLTFGLLVTLGLLNFYLAPSGRALAKIVVGGWLIATCLGGTYLVLRRTPDFIGPTDKTEQFDVRPITAYLDRAAPGLLLVDIPRDTTWMFAYYNEFAFGRYPAYFQSGLVIDNGVQYQNLWLQTLTRAPDYAVVAKSRDYIGAEHLGTLVAETRDLALYKIDSTDLQAFQDREALERQQESALAQFPSLIH